MKKRMILLTLIIGLCVVGLLEWTYGAKGIKAYYVEDEVGQTLGVCMTPYDTQELLDETLELETTEIHITKHLIEPFSKEELERLIEVLEGYKGEIWLSFYGDDVEMQRTILGYYSEIEESLTHPERLHKVYYPLKEEVDASFKIGEDYVLGVNIKRAEDLAFLAHLEENTDEMPIIVNEWLLETYSFDLPIMLDTLERLYYGQPMDYPNVKMIRVMGEPMEAVAKVRTFYERLLSQSWISTTYPTTEGMPYSRLIGSKESGKVDALQLLLPDQDEAIEYVEYKINEKIAGSISRYPYRLDVEKAYLHHGMNEVRTIIWLKEHKEPLVSTYYIYWNGNHFYKERAKRKGETYDLSQKPNTSYIPVLMYHKFLENVSEEEKSIAVSTKRFEAQLKALLNKGYTPIDFKQLYDYLEGRSGLPKKPILLTSDDGYLCNYEIAYPLLKQYQVKATFFVPTAHMENNLYNDHFSWEEAREMEESGLIDIQSHSHNHYDMSQFSHEEVLYEMAASFDEIESHLGKRDVKVLAFPQFRHTRKVQDWVKEAGVHLQVTDLVKRRYTTESTEIRRIHVGEEMTPSDLIQTIEKMTK